MLLHSVTDPSTLERWDLVIDAASTGVHGDADAPTIAAVIRKRFDFE